MGTNIDKSPEGQAPDSCNSANPHRLLNRARVSWHLSDGHMSEATVQTHKQAIYWELLAVRCQRGETRAFSELLDAWERPLLYYIRRLLGQRDVEWDVLQEVWMRVFRGIGSLREPRRLPIWLYRIARRSAMRYLREQYSEPALEQNVSDLDAIEVEIDERLHFAPKMPSRCIEPSHNFRLRFAKC